MEKLKSCRNCGSSNLHHYKASREVECNDCSECLSEGDWQSPRPVEDHQTAIIEAQAELIEAYENLEAARNNTTRIPATWNDAQSRLVCAREKLCELQGGE